MDWYNNSKFDKREIKTINTPMKISPGIVHPDYHPYEIISSHKNIPIGNLIYAVDINRKIIIIISINILQIFIKEGIETIMLKKLEKISKRNNMKIMTSELYESYYPEEPTNNLSQKKWEEN